MTWRTYINMRAYRHNYTQIELYKNGQRLWPMSRFWKVCLFVWLYINMRRITLKIYSYTLWWPHSKSITYPYIQFVFSNLKGVLHPWALFLKTLCIFSKNKATSDKVSYGSGQKCSKELKSHSFTSVETIVVKLQWKMCKNQYFPCFEP